MYNEKYMNFAIKLAKKAYKLNEVPVGAVIVSNEEIIGFGYNKKESKNTVLEHAELTAIKMASKKINNWRLFNCDIYITLEPCPMCASAIKQSRIKNVYYGTKSLNISNYSIINEIFNDNFANSNNIMVNNMNIDECSILISEFFKKRR